MRILSLIAALVATFAIAQPVAADIVVNVDQRASRIPGQPYRRCVIGSQLHRNPFDVESVAKRQV
jgi:hypothetical protein